MWSYANHDILGAPHFSSKLATPTPPKEKPTPTPTPTKPGGGGDPKIDFTPTVTIHLPLGGKQHPYVLSNTYDAACKGTAGVDNSTALTSEIYYSWHSTAEEIPNEQVRMVWCLADNYGFDTTRTWGAQAFTNAVTSTASADYKHYRGRVWLIFNEPDEKWEQCGTKTIGESLVRHAPITSAQRYIELVDLVREHDPSARFAPGGLLVIGANEGKNWWSDFMYTITSTDRLDTVDIIHIHGYAEAEGSGGCDIDAHPDFPTAGGWCMDELFDVLDDWYDDYHVGFGLGDKEIWITEVGAMPSKVREGLEDVYGANPGYSSQAYTDVISNVMNVYQDWFASEENPGYDKILWYVTQDGVANWCTELYSTTPSVLSPLGVDWEAWNPNCP